MLNYLSKTHLNSNVGAAKFYFIGIGALVSILIVAAVAIFLSPDLKNTLNLSGGEKLEKSRVAGEIVDINYDDEFFVIEDNGTGEEFKINLPEGTQIETGGGGSGTYTLGDLELGQYIELINVKYTSSGGGVSNKKGGGSNNNGGGGSNKNGDEDQNEVDDWDDIYIYFPFPVISTEVISADSASTSLEVDTTTTPVKKFTVIINSETIISSITAGDTRNNVPFGELQSGWKLDIFTEEDPSDNVTLTALAIFITKK